MHWLSLYFLLRGSLFISHELLLHGYSFILVRWLFLVTNILIFPLLDMWTVDMRCVELSATWIQATRPPLESHISYFSFLVIVIHAINRAHVLLSYYMYHAILVLELYSLNIINITWQWERPDSWLDLVGWMSGSIVCPTAGDGVVLAAVYYSSWAPISRYVISSLSFRFPLLVIALAGWSWS